MQSAISVKNLSKCYRLGVINRQTLVEEVHYWWLKVRGKDPRTYFSKVGHSATDAGKVAAEKEDRQRYWALKDLSFDVAPGQVIGIIGRNGAGKSTLLKILTRITEPTSGEAIINGRVGSLLEIGTGFHPELTGRENIYMNGAILGMKKREIDAKLDEIIAFSEIEKFIDTPVKRYSSGMYVRLAFAVAAHLEPEILLVDEVLAVGDNQFQRKCLGKMGEIAGRGRTVLFVSHNMGAVRNLCDTGLWLDNGEVSDIGPVGEVINHYLMFGHSCAECIFDDDADKDASIFAVRMMNAQGQLASNIQNKEAFQVQIEYVVRVPIKGLRVSFRIGTADGSVVLTTANVENSADAERVTSAGCYRSSCHVPPLLLNEGNYQIMQVGLDVPRVRIIDNKNSLQSFTIVKTGGPSSLHSEKWAGIICTPFAWTLESVHNKASYPCTTSEVV